MPEQLHPQDIARRSFDVVRRGFDQHAVQGFLHEVSSLVERLQRAERELRERAERAEARAEMTAHPDEAAMLELLGEETTRVLSSAREAAADIRAKAEASAERLIADATAEAASLRSAAAVEAEELRAAARAESDRLLEQARTELDRRSAEAQEAAERIRADAESAAEALRDEGRRVLEAAQQEAAATVDAAKAEGRAMVAEAQAVRERMLRDLAARRKKARLQVEQLDAGRERLLHAYDVVRRTVDEATHELHGALVDARAAADAAARRVEDEPEPSLEQLDAEVAEAALALRGAEADDEEADDEQAGDEPLDDHDAPHDQAAPHDEGPSARSAEAPAGERSPAPAEASSTAQPASNGAGDPNSLTALSSGRRSRRSRRRKGPEDAPAGEVTEPEPRSDDEGVRVLGDVVHEGAAVTADDAAEAPAGEAPPAEPPAQSAAEPAPGAPGSEAAELPPSSDAVEDPTPDDGDAPAASADEVFAKLRAEATEPEAAEPAPEPADAAEGPVAAEPEPSEAVEPAAGDADGAPDEDQGAGEEAPVADEAAAAFRARDEALTPIEKELARQLKRALADEQNEVLDLLRREQPTGLDGLLPDHDAHVARWATVVADVLGEGAAAGASWAGGSPGTVVDLSTELARALVEPLRDRIDRSFAASAGNLDDVADRVRALYREWKGQRLTDSATHYAAAAYAHGCFDALTKRSQVRWVVDPATAPCPDCDDNALAGTITKGEPFPTGTRCAPAHPGCRCLVVAG